MPTTTEEADDPFLAFAESLDAADSITKSAPSGAANPEARTTVPVDTWAAAVDAVAAVYDEIERAKAGIRAKQAAVRDLLMKHPHVLALDPEVGGSSDTVLSGGKWALKATKKRSPQFDQNELRRLDLEAHSLTGSASAPDPLTVKYGVADMSRLADPDAVIKGHRDTVTFETLGLI